MVRILNASQKASRQAKHVQIAFHHFPLLALALHSDITHTHTGCTTAFQHLVLALFGPVGATFCSPPYYKTTRKLWSIPSAEPTATQTNWNRESTRPVRCVVGEPQLVQTGGMQLSNSQLLRALLAQAYWCGDVVQVPLPAPQSVGRRCVRHVLYNKQYEIPSN